jgi:hypothetical protein
MLIAALIFYKLEGGVKQFNRLKSLTVSKCNFCMCFVFDSRFILHIPSEERDNAIRVCFQIELAHWFYLDFYMQNTPGLPQCGIRDFAKADILFVIMIVFYIY